MKKQSSLFDIISPIMVGPSSSHTAGAVRLGLLASSIYGEKIKKVTFKLYNSYAQTGKGHGTDKGLLAGVLGFQPDDVRIRDVFNSNEAKNIEYSFEYLEDFNRHPNAVDFIFENSQKMVISGNSTGGGNVEIVRINDFTVNLNGEYNTLIMAHKDTVGVVSRVSGLIQNEGVNIASAIIDRAAKGEEASMCISLDSPLSRDVIEKIGAMEGVYFVRHVGKLENWDEK